MEILYEDNHIIVVNKPVNMPVCEDESQDKDLLNEIKDYLKEKYNKPGNVYCGLIHRLDRPVGGVMVFAKTSKAASRLSDSLRQNQFHKTYLAVVDGISKKRDHLEDFLLKDPKTNMVKVDKNGKKAILDYELIDTNETNSLLIVDLQTGRSHQIRVQLSHSQLPIYGDQRYNKKAKVGQQIALFAYKLSFPHPISKEMLTFCVKPKTKPFTLFNLEVL